MKKLKLKNKGKDVHIYKGKDLLAKVKGAKGDLSKKGKYFDKPNIKEKRISMYVGTNFKNDNTCLLYTSPSPRDDELSRMPSSA